MVVALLVVLAYDTSQPDPPRVTRRDVDEAVAQALAAATPQPPAAAQAYEVVRPSVVRIEALLPDQVAEPEGAVGTGVVIEEKGTILTSLHVVEGAAGIKVIFADGSESPAEISIKKPENDLAVLYPEVTPDDLVPATLTSTAALSIGDEVFAVGNPFGIRDSLTAGVVSGLGRNFRAPESGTVLTNMIQFDAAVNPGNSGGPLVTREGEVVGIVTGLLNPGEEDVFIGIGFAVPIETAAEAAGPPIY